MKNTENLTIVLLLAAAAILSTLLVTTWISTGDEALASPAATSRSGYIVATGQWNSGLDIVYIIDLRAKRLNAYVLDTQQNAVVPKSSIDLEPLFRE